MRYIVVPALLGLLAWLSAFAAAGEPPPRLTLDCGDGVKMELILIPAGSFQMGSPETEAEREDDEIPHRQTIEQPFYMGIYEVTQAQYQAVTGANPSRFKGDDLPVESVSLYGVEDFCKKLSAKTGRKVRLPTEAEWEYACRSETETPFNTGETISTDQANYKGDSAYGKGRVGVNRGKTVPVGSFPPNAWGLHDLHGNVNEWCSDWYQGYDTRGTDKAWSHGEFVCRGGSFASDPGFSRSASRFRTVPQITSHVIGFRVVVDFEATRKPAEGDESPTLPRRFGKEQAITDAVTAVHAGDFRIICIDGGYVPDYPLFDEAGHYNARDLYESSVLRCGYFLFLISVPFPCAGIGPTNNYPCKALYDRDYIAAYNTVVYNWLKRNPDQIADFAVKDRTSEKYPKFPREPDGVFVFEAFSQPGEAPAAP